jgi:hypothetical protein
VTFLGRKEVKTTKSPMLLNYQIKMRLEDYLKNHYLKVDKVTSWKCPICYSEYGTKTHSEKCLDECRERVLKENVNKLKPDSRNIVCKGCVILGNACLKCSKCKEQLEHLKKPKLTL